MNIKTDDKLLELICLGKVGHSRTRGTVVFFDSFKNLKTLNFKVSMVI